MEEINQSGVCVIKLPEEFSLHQKVPTIIRGIKEIIDAEKALLDLEFPITSEHPIQIVLGGFGATGLPSLSHHPEIRDIRVQVYNHMLPYFSKQFPGRNIEALFDRFSIRRVGTTISGESWHRDVGFKDQGDIIYGGWINLDPPESSSQYFSCIPGNILSSTIDQLGFAKFKKEEMIQLEKDFKRTGPIEVKPGSIIIFDQSIAHKISGTKANKTSYRLYFGWRITHSSLPICDKTKIISQQLTPSLPSGQEAYMYSKMHWCNWKNRIQEFSKKFKSDFFDSDPKRSDCIYRVLPGLVATGLEFPAYTQEEREIFYPKLLIVNEDPFIEDPFIENPPAKKLCKNLHSV